jgi:hypothetical protein
VCCVVAKEEEDEDEDEAEGEEGDGDVERMVLMERGW